MKITGNRDIAHAFFYQTGQYYRKSRFTCSYEDDTFFSYATAIGRKYKTDNGDDILLYSKDSMSHSTGGHLSYLRSACPFGMNISVPLQFGCSCIRLSDIVDDLIGTMEFYSNQKLTQKANREGFSYAYRTLKVLVNNFSKHRELTSQRTLENIKSELARFKDLYEDLNDETKLAELKKIQAKADRERAQKLKEELKDLLKDFGYLELLHWAYGYGSSCNPDLRKKLRKYFNPKNELSFVWIDHNVPDGSQCVTSQGIKMDTDEVNIALRLWLAGKLKRGMKIEYYTVVDIQPSFVKVGCHKIPVENLKELAKALEIPDVESDANENENENEKGE
jgi:hypothetical protein